MKRSRTLWSSAFFLPLIFVVISIQQNNGAEGEQLRGLGRLKRQLGSEVFEGYDGPNNRLLASWPPPTPRESFLNDYFSTAIEHRRQKRTK